MGHPAKGACSKHKKWPEGGSCVADFSLRGFLHLVEDPKRFVRNDNNRRHINFVIPTKEGSSCNTLCHPDVGGILVCCKRVESVRGFSTMRFLVRRDDKVKECQYDKAKA